MRQIRFRVVTLQLLLQLHWCCFGSRRRWVLYLPLSQRESRQDVSWGGTTMRSMSQRLCFWQESYLRLCCTGRYENLREIDEPLNGANVPLLVRRGGCGTKKISAKPTLAPQTGWSLTKYCNIACERPPRPLHQRMLR